MKARNRAMLRGGRQTTNFTVPVTEDLLQEITQRTVENFHPKKIILFGSQVWGQPQPDSDIDLLVIMESSERPIVRATRVRDVCRPKFVAMDILVRTPGEIAERVKLKDPFILDIIHRGRVLYEA